MSLLPLLLAALSWGASSPREEARVLFQAGLRAHADGDAKGALKKWRRCLEVAPPRSPERGDCALFEDMHGRSRAQDADDAHPRARRAHRAGLVAYRAGDTAQAGRLWRACLANAPAGSAVVQDCLTSLELVKAPSAPAPTVRAPRARSEDAARRVYMEGMVLFQKGDEAGAERAWNECLELAPPRGPTELDCRAGLGFLASRRGR
ncbi:MAG: hypothetical protein SF051_15790 [Elusimicrobiota bacterium]|nr:hypothetical protein [Elusimicrobiota bacterium]